jgi:hypothetical protein
MTLTDITDRATLIDQIRGVIQQTIFDQTATWEESFDAGPGTVVGVPDAALVAAQTVVDAGWRP